MLKLLKNKQAIVLDTDIGYDPDDSLALLLALKLPNVDILAIITSDEDIHGSRASYAYNLIRCMHENITIYSGVSYSPTPKLSIQNEYLTNRPVKPFNVDEMFVMLEDYFINNNKKINYICIGGMTNLRLLIDSFPEVTQYINFYFTGGAFNYRKKGRHTHNIRLDYDSAKMIFLNSGLNKKIIPSDITFNNTSIRFSKVELVKNIPPSLDILKKQINCFCKLKRVDDILLSDVITLLSSTTNSFHWLLNQKILFDRNGVFELSAKFNVQLDILQEPTPQLVLNIKEYILNVLMSFSV